MNALTEKDARTKWCPFVRYVSGNGDDGDDGEGSANRWGEFPNPSPCRCIASNCMAWQWSGTVKDPTGYCGLAGK